MSDEILGKVRLGKVLGVKNANKFNGNSFWSAGGRELGFGRLLKATSPLFPIYPGRKLRIFWSAL